MLSTILQTTFLFKPQSPPFPSRRKKLKISRKKPSFLASASGNPNGFSWDSLSSSIRRGSQRFLDKFSEILKETGVDSGDAQKEFLPNLRVVKASLKMVSIVSGLSWSLSSSVGTNGIIGRSVFSFFFYEYIHLVSFLWDFGLLFCYVENVCIFFEAHDTMVTPLKLLVCFLMTWNFANLKISVVKDGESCIGWWLP